MQWTCSTLKIERTVESSKDMQARAHLCGKAMGAPFTIAISQGVLVAFSFLETATIIFVETAFIEAAFAAVAKLLLAVAASIAE